MRRLAVAVALAALAAAGARAAEPVPAGDDLLRRARAVIRAHPAPPYVVYTLERRDRVDGWPDQQNSYAMRIWCRTADGSALARDLFGTRAVGGAHHLDVRFDDRVDPGPPTADLLDAAVTAVPTPSPAPAPGETPIGRVVVFVETVYRVVSVAREGDAWHLVVTPRRDPARFRLRELVLDAETLLVRGAVTADHLFAGTESVPERFEARFTARDGRALLIGIHGRTDPRAVPRPTHVYETDYVYRAVAFPASLPDWYFDPASYGRHAAELPS